MRASRPMLFALSAILALVSCVSIKVNVYFDQERAEEAADRVLDKTGYPAEQAKPPAAGESHGALRETGPLQLCALDRALLAVTDPACPPAEAGDTPNIDVESPAISKIAARMKERWEKRLEAAFERKNLGITNQAGFTIRNLDGVSDDKERADLKKGVADENADHEELFREIAKANKLAADAIPQIRKAFTKRYQERARAGWWIQDEEGKWSQKG